VEDGEEDNLFGRLGWDFLTILRGLRSIDKKPWEREKMSVGGETREVRKGLSPLWERFRNLLYLIFARGVKRNT